MSSKRRLEGYLMVDHRESPGVRAEDIPPTILERYGPPIVAQGQLYESATLTCCHCQRIVILNPLRTRARTYCQKCDEYTCDRPACRLECRPFAKVIDYFLNWGAKLIGGARC